VTGGDKIYKDPIATAKRYSTTPDNIILKVIEPTVAAAKELFREELHYLGTNGLANYASTRIYTSHVHRDKVLPFLRETIVERFDMKRYIEQTIKQCLIHGQHDEDHINFVLY
jgi:hypothetical protein